MASCVLAQPLVTYAGALKLVLDSAGFGQMLLSQLKTDMR